MAKDRSKKTAVSWAHNFFLDISPRGHVTAGMRGTPISVTVEMNPETKKQSQDTESYERTIEVGSIWYNEMQRIAHVAAITVKHHWDVWRDTGEVPLGPLCCTFEPKSKREIHSKICKHCGQAPDGPLHSREAHDKVAAVYGPAILN